jgi:hypothetical protein
VRSHIGLPDLLKWRIKMSMLGSNLERSGGLMWRVKLLERIAVINRKNVTAF